MGETVRIAQVRIDHADKVLFGPDGPPVTKADLARYCADIAEAMLPHTRGRPISMERFPHGIDGESFFEKRAPAYFPDFVHRVRV
ncbi:DNA ligase, partial [Burkholderia multivorans]